MIVNFGFVFKRNCFHACLTSLLLDGVRGVLFAFHINPNALLYHNPPEKGVSRSCFQSNTKLIKIKWQLSYAFTKIDDMEVNLTVISPFRILSLMQVQLVCQILSFLTFIIEIRELKIIQIITKTIYHKTLQQNLLNSMLALNLASPHYYQSKCTQPYCDTTAL